MSDRMMAMRRRKAVSPVLATLLMIAVAVALAVVIFTWSQGFLSSTSSAVGTEQGAQNIAAQSQIAIENVIVNPTSGSESIKIIVRNVGSVTVNVSSIQIQGMPSNSGFKNFLTAIVNDDSNGIQTVTPSGHGVDTGDFSSSSGSYTLSKGSGTVITVDLSGADTGWKPASGDFITVKVTTTVGSFAQYSVTVP